MNVCSNYGSGRCRSCSLLGLSDGPEVFGVSAREKDARFREEAERELGPRAAAATAELFSPRTVFPSRAKVKAAVAGSWEAPFVGLIDEHYQGVDLLDCPLHLPLLNRVLRQLKELIREFKLFPYDIAARRGELKALMVISNREQSEALLRFVLRSREAVPRAAKAAGRLMAAEPALKVASVNLQPLPAAVLEGPDELLLTEERFIWESYDTCRLALQPQSFVQVTPETAAALYAHVARRVAQLRPREVLDLYCGAGGFLLSCSGMERGRGLELSACAVECAARSAAAAGRSELTFAEADVDRLRELPGHPEVVIVNPPRRGLSPGLIEAISASAARSVIYSSCNPATLFRDLKAFGSSFTLEDLAPFDMFPLTPHLEAAAVMRR